MVLFSKTRVILSLKLKLALPLTILYQLATFEAPSYNHFRNSLITIFQCPNSKRAITLKNNNNFFSKILPGNLLIIFYQLTMFEAPSYNGF